MEQHLFLELLSKGEVEAALMKAQKAVLNPSKRWKEYMEDRDEKGANKFADDEVKFSPNVVCVEVCDSGITYTPLVGILMRVCRFLLWDCRIWHLLIYLG